MTTATASQIRLMAHQLRAVELARKHARFGFFLEPGVGKTISMLAVHRERPTPTVVLCPKAIMKSAWASDAEKMGMPVTILHGTPQKRSALVEELSAMFDAEIVSSMSRANDDSHDMPLIVTSFETFRKPEVRAQLRDELGVRRIIIDESSKIKNHESQISKAVHRFADDMTEVYLLSGTPAPNGPEEYWSQLRALDHRPGGVADVPFGTFPPNFYRWSNYWMYPQKRMIQGKERIVGWRMREDRSEAFSRMLASVSWALRMEDCIDIKPATSHKITVDLSPAEQKAYDDMLQHLIAEFDGEKVSVQAAAQLMKLRQITGGIFYESSGARSIGTTKIEALGELLESIGTEPVVIWAEFTAEIDAIAKLCGKMGRRHRVLDGRGRDNGAEAAAFQSGNECDTLICHPASVGHGVTLTRARYAVYYSCGFSYEQHEQSRRRIYRNGQKRKCVFWYLVARDTVDQHALMVLRRKASASEGVLSVLRELAQR